jgi:hypothetical protein
MDSEDGTVSPFGIIPHFAVAPIAQEDLIAIDTQHQFAIGGLRY